MKNSFLKFSLLPLSLGLCLSAQAASIVSLQGQSVSPMLSDFKETGRYQDFKNQLHVRVQQYYQGYPVLGADAIIHLPHTQSNLTTLTSVLQAAKTQSATLTGQMFAGLSADLEKTSPVVFTKVQLQKAIQRATMLFKEKNRQGLSIDGQHAQLKVFVNRNQSAHYVYEVRLSAKPTEATKIPSKPVYIMDAMSFEIYKQWDEVKTGMVAANGGGFGGNVKSGRVSYNGLPGQKPMFTITRDTSRRICYLNNSRVEVRDTRNPSRVMNYDCRSPDKRNNNVFWSASFDMANGGYSPGNDALYDGGVINDLYLQWYKLPPLVTSDHKPMLLTMIVHYKMDNAYWDGNTMNFGDGISYFYPLTSLGVAAHEVSHGFTEQHSNLDYEGQSGGLNESYSDMAAMAAEYFTTGSSSWQIGGEVFKGQGSLRYMKQPSLDCAGGTPGDDCSIDNASQYNDDLDVHYSSGVYNRMFYLLSTTSGWNTHKAFDVMVQANASYWTPSVTFNQAACGVLSAARDYQYDVNAVTTALNAVGVSVAECGST